MSDITAGIIGFLFCLAVLSVFVLIVLKIKKAIKAKKEKICENAKIQTEKMNDMKNILD